MPDASALYTAATLRHVLPLFDELERRIELGGQPPSLRNFMERQTVGS